MKLATLTLALLGSMALTGCSNLVSLNPFVTEKQAVLDPNLLGTWKGSGGELVIVQQNKSSYSITYTEGKEGAQKFTALLFRSGDAELLDLVSESDAVLQVPVHALVRVWPEGSLLRWTFLDSKWLREQATQQLASQPQGDSILLTAPGEAVRSVFLQHGGDSKAYEKDTNVLTRMP